jgi:glutaredoxin-related protein
MGGGDIIVEMAEMGTLKPAMEKAVELFKNQQ